MRTATTLLVCAFFGAPESVAQQPPQPPAAMPQRSSGSGESTDHCQHSSELQRELKQMRALLQQMQKNLAAVATGETPLKHQFRLELELWQLMLDRLEKEDSRRRPPTSKDSN